MSPSHHSSTSTSSVQEVNTSTEKNGTSIADHEPQGKRELNPRIQEGQSLNESLESTRQKNRSENSSPSVKVLIDKQPMELKPIPNEVIVEGPNVEISNENINDDMISALQDVQES
ncbi:hypothetical protein SUGI_0274660 [Cryptomeria japonica]|nr:hypothetical protein SUGI_0274660 [Cryptomeria japonica]